MLELFNAPACSIVRMYWCIGVLNPSFDSHKFFSVSVLDRVNNLHPQFIQSKVPNCVLVSFHHAVKLYRDVFIKYPELLN